MRRLATILLSVWLAFSLVSCGKDAVEDLGQLKAQEGIYTYPGLSWGMTVDQAAAATGWEIPEPQKLYNEEGEFVDSIATLQGISFGGQSWSVQLQFDTEGALWSVSLVQSGTAADLEKVFKAYDSSLAGQYGSPSQAEYGKVIETESGNLLDNLVTWEVTDEAGQRFNGLALSYRHREGHEMGSLALAMNYQK